MDTFSPEYIRSYSDEFKSLPSEYYDSGCRDWRDELTHQPKIPENWPTHHDDPKGYSDEAKHFLIHVCSSRGIDKTPPNRRNKMYYAVKYANIFARAARLAERDPLAMPDKEYHRLYDLQRRYEELQAILEGSKPYELQCVYNRERKD